MALVLIAHSVLSTYTHTSHFCRNLLASHFSFSEAPQSPQLEAEFLCGSPHSLKPNHGVWCWLPLTHFLPFLGAQWCYLAVEPPQASQTHRLFVFGALTTPNSTLLLAQGLLKQSKAHWPLIALECWSSPEPFLKSDLGRGKYVDFGPRIPVPSLFACRLPNLWPGQVSQPHAYVVPSVQWSLRNLFHLVGNTTLNVKHTPGRWVQEAVWSSG